MVVQGREWVWALPFRPFWCYRVTMSRMLSSVADLCGRFWSLRLYVAEAGRLGLLHRRRSFMTRSGLANLYFAFLHFCFCFCVFLFRGFSRVDCLLWSSSTRDYPTVPSRGPSANDLHLLSHDDGHMHVMDGSEIFPGTMYRYTRASLFGEATRLTGCICKSKKRLREISPEWLC